MNKIFPRYVGNEHQSNRVVRLQLQIQAVLQRLLSRPLQFGREVLKVRREIHPYEFQRQGQRAPGRSAPRVFFDRYVEGTAVYLASGDVHAQLVVSGTLGNKRDDHGMSRTVPHRQGLLGVASRPLESDTQLGDVG